MKNTKTKKLCDTCYYNLSYCIETSCENCKIHLPASGDPFNIVCPCLTIGEGDVCENYEPIEGGENERLQKTV